MYIHTLKSFTVPISVEEWMGSKSDASKQILLSYLIDLTEDLPFLGPVTACALESSATLWFTFAEEIDADMFCHDLAGHWRKGWWLTND